MPLNSYFMQLSHCEVLNGVLWILRSGARRQDLPEHSPPYQTCHRRYQQWVRKGVLNDVLETPAQDLQERGELDLSLSLNLARNFASLGAMTPVQYEFVEFLAK